MRLPYTAYYSAPNLTGSISSRPWWGSFGMNKGSIREKRDATAANDRKTRRLDATRKREAPYSLFCFASALYTSWSFTTSYSAPVYWKLHVVCEPMDEVGQAAAVGFNVESYPSGWMGGEEADRRVRWARGTFRIKRRDPKCYSATGRVKLEEKAR